MLWIKKRALEELRKIDLMFNSYPQYLKETDVYVSESEYNLENVVQPDNMDNER